ncbi:PRTRC system protein B [Mucilaginibacter celer]|uniref:PRTRC system protein B n=2 Tax=Mucilaginibacter celer TaxID=2305508 RepID=A0A494VSP4_9SPHI|nr:PRTRC system protein B [Mucilaginibacter celer]
MLMTMKNISQQFNSRFEPFKALLIYRHDEAGEISRFQSNEPQTQIYVESYDIGTNGKPVNAHPLSVKEMGALAELLQTSQDLKGGYLKSRGLLPLNVLYVNQQGNGYAVWHSPPREVTLFFTADLNIPSGKFKIPAMVWKADAEHLSVYALKGKQRPAGNTALQHAPYLNIYNSGQVCMGTVNIAISKTECLEDFMSLWEQYFFNSQFSHSISGNHSSRTNTTDLWRTLAGTGRDFPQEELIKTGYTLKQIIV